MRNGYSMNFVTNTMTITRGFNRRASNSNTNEYQLLMGLRRDFPNLRIVFYAPKRKRTARLTYDKMICYIGCQNDAPARLQEFNVIRETSIAQASPYNYVKSWFLREFPNYNEIPKFDENGNITSIIAAAEPKTVSKTEKQKNDAA
jgi:hypothetical protein